MSPALWALVGIGVVVLLAWGYVAACERAFEALNWEDDDGN